MLLLLALLTASAASAVPPDFIGPGAVRRNDDGPVYNAEDVALLLRRVSAETTDRAWLACTIATFAVYTMIIVVPRVTFEVAIGHVRISLVPAAFSLYVVAALVSHRYIEPATHRIMSTWLVTVTSWRHRRTQHAYRPVLIAVGVMMAVAIGMLWLMTMSDSTTRLLVTATLQPVFFGVAGTLFTDRHAHRVALG